MENPNLEPPEHPFLSPTVGSSLSHAWKQMWSQMGTLLALVILFIVISIPSATLNWELDPDTLSLPPNFWPLFLGSTLYSLLIIQPITYGYHYSTMKVARQERVEPADLFEAFKNYVNTVLSAILVGTLTILGLVLLIVPGIIVACKLYFVPLLVVDKKMSALEAINTSWRMTDGHAFTIFALGFVSIFIALGGLLFFFVGIIPAAIWIQTAFGTLYHTISSTTDIDHY